MVAYDTTKAFLIFLAAFAIIAAAVVVGFIAHWVACIIWIRIERVVLDRWLRAEDFFARRPFRRRLPIYRMKLLGGGIVNLLYWMGGCHKRYSATSYLEDTDAEQASRARKLLRKKGALRRHTRFQQSSIDGLVNEQAGVLIQLHGLNIFTTGDIRQRQQTLEMRLQYIQRDLRELDPSRIDHSHYMSFGDEG